MMSATPASARILSSLPHRLPACPDARLALFAMRRMGAHGLHDARAAQAMLSGFGAGFRRPLVLMRALMAEIAGHAAGTIAVAPCCCSRMTAAEAAFVRIVAEAETRPVHARTLLADLLGIANVDGVLAAAAAVAAAFADGGRPIGTR